MAAPNVFNTSTITSSTGKLAVTGSATAIVSNASSSGKVYMIKSLYISNIHATNTGTITVDVYDGATPYRIGLSISVPIQCTIVPIGTDAPVFLVEGDSLRLTANASSTFEAVCSYDILS